MPNEISTFVSQFRALFWQNFENYGIRNSIEFDFGIETIRILIRIDSLARKKKSDKTFLEAPGKYKNELINETERTSTLENVPEEVID